MTRAAFSPKTLKPYEPAVLIAWARRGIDHAEVLLATTEHKTPKYVHWRACAARDLAKAKNELALAEGIRGPAVTAGVGRDDCGVSPAPSSFEGHVWGAMIEAAGAIATCRTSQPGGGDWPEFNRAWVEETHEQFADLTRNVGVEA